MLSFFSPMISKWLMIGDGSELTFEKWLDIVSKSYPEIIDMKHFKIPIKDEKIFDKAEEFDCCAIFEGIPFGKESTHILLNKWRNDTKGKPALIVFMNLPRRQGSTDLDKIGDDLIKAQKYYQSQGQDFCTLKSKDDVLEVVLHHCSCYCQHIYELKGKLEILRDDVDTLFKSDYEYFLESCKHDNGCLTEASKAEICSLKSVKKYIQSQYLWQCYNEAAKQKLFSESGAMNELCKIYKTYMQELFATFDGNLNYECINLITVLRNRFNDFMRPQQNKYQGKISLQDVKDDVVYTYLTENRQGRFYGIKTEYLKQLKIFIELEAKDVLRNQLEFKYKEFDNELKE